MVYPNLKKNLKYMIIVFLEIGEYITYNSHESPKHRWGEAEMNSESFKNIVSENSIGPRWRGLKLFNFTQNHQGAPGMNYRSL